MNIFEIAKKMEVEGKTLYENQLKITTNEGLRAILKMLIQQEQSHYETFDMMEKHTHKKIKINHVDGIKGYFQELKDKHIPKEQLKFYEMVLVTEQNAQKFYKELADKQTDKEARMQIIEIMEEEALHEIIISNLIKFIKGPLDWTENAEFNELEDN
jgi:rubrerythrin